MNVHIDANMAKVIMGAMALCFSEGIDGVVCPVEGETSEEAGCRLVRAVHSVHPDAVAFYSWLPSVKRLMKEQQ